MFDFLKKITEKIGALYITPSGQTPKISGSRAIAPPGIRDIDILEYGILFV